MNSSQNTIKNILFSIYRDERKVFRFSDIVLLTGETNFQSLNKKMNYYVRTGRLMNPRKGIYTKSDYDPAELACSIYTPSYVSMEYVLQKSGVIFQYDSSVTSVSYLSRSIEVGDITYRYRKIKREILLNTAGINRQKDYINIASAERAFLDLMYLSPEYYFDNLNPLNKKMVRKLLTIYQSIALSKRINKLIEND